MGRCAVFIDGGYLDKILIEEFNSIRIDFDKLSRLLSADYDLLRTYYYTCEPYQSDPPTPEEKQRLSNAQKFHYALTKIPNFQLRFGKLYFGGLKENYEPIFYQKRVDVLLSIDIVSLSEKRSIDTAIILAGDSDFIPAIKLVKNIGIRTILYCGQNVHEELKNNSDLVINITNEMILNIRRDESKTKKYK